MYIRKLTFRENEGQQIEWLIDEVHLGKINLIVGQNSSGKTRTLNALSLMVDLLTGSTDIPKVNGKYMVLFLEDKDEIQLEFEYDSGNIIQEKLLWNKESLLERWVDGSGNIRYQGSDKEITLEFGISKNQLACFAKRDKLQHPFLERIFMWANDMRRFDFSGNLGKDSYELMSAFEESEINFRDTNASLVPIVYIGNENYPKYRDVLIGDMNAIGYNLEDLGIVQYSEKTYKAGQDRFAVYTKEKGLEKKVTQKDMSQGMFRAFSVLARINRYMLEGKKGCIVIDDIGEGLDFSRARLLVNLLVKKAKDSDLQLIMSTNDSFIMNTVEIENWAVLHRDGNKISLYNYENSKEIFEDFKFTGLNNFDFYASEFFKSGFSDKSE